MRGRVEELEALLELAQRRANNAEDLIRRIEAIIKAAEADPYGYGAAGDIAQAIRIYRDNAGTR